jgi:hypothetical protein
VHPTQYLKKPQTPKELTEWYASPITFTVTRDHDVIRVRAQDECKAAEADISIERTSCTQPYLYGVLSGIGLTILIIGLL